jgi:tRNA threonylcarbamoyladenosine biosynthesis protein TsaB
MLLALDTSTSNAGLALVAAAEAAETLAELNWSVGRRHSVELLQRLEWLLSTSGARMEWLSGVAVATGPGSFNGLRVALSTAKSLALARGLPLYGVPTLDICAWGHADTMRPIWAILEAGRGQVYAARYTGLEGLDGLEALARSADGWKPTGGYATLTLEELAAHVRSEANGALLCGEWRSETRVALEALLADWVGLGERVRFASRLRIRRGVWLAELALARAARGLRDDPATLEPLYLRRPAITTSGKRGVAPTAAAESEIAESEREEASHALQG